MQGIHHGDLRDDVDESDPIWECAVCGRPRLCPYGAPCAGDPREACWSCGDLLALPTRETPTLAFSLQDR